jgi:hypothetical protein
MARSAPAAGRKRCRSAGRGISVQDVLHLRGNVSGMPRNRIDRVSVWIKSVLKDSNSLKHAYLLSREQGTSA